MSEAVQIVRSRSHDTFIHYKFIRGVCGVCVGGISVCSLEAFCVTQKNMTDHHQKE